MSEVEVIPPGGISDQEAAEAARALQDVTTSGKIIEDRGVYTKVCSALSALYKGGRLNTLVPALPLMLVLRGAPYTMLRHFPMEPFFKLRIPRRTVWKSARQISKSTSNAANIVVSSILLRYFRTLYVAPRFDQTKRFSTDYVRPFLIESPIGTAVMRSPGSQSVLQRDFPSKSTAYFSYAFLDCDRIRGFSVDRLIYDEAQDLDWTFIPVINETMAASNYKLETYTGTPKTFDNLLEMEWTKSSQAEFCIKCDHCGYWNIPSIKHDLLAMIEPKGLSCAKCHRLIDARDGMWIHAIPSRSNEYEGYHAPQVIFPMHYEPNPMTGSREAWRDIVLAKAGEIPPDKFYNEKLGESYDLRSALLSLSDLKAASVLKWPNEMREAMRNSRGYVMKIVGVDWGGGGEDGISLTAVSVLGFLPDLTFDTLYTTKLTNVTDHVSEVRYILHVYKAFGATLLAHDYAGSGSVRETLLVQAGFDPKKIFPAHYVRAAVGRMVKYNAPSDKTARAYYTLDKARCIALVCLLIKSGGGRFPQFSSWEKEAEDFLSLVEDKHSTQTADVYLIDKKATGSDDIVHSIVFAATAYWHSQQRYPDMAKMTGIKLTTAQKSQLHPTNPHFGE